MQLMPYSAEKKIYHNFSFKVLQKVIIDMHKLKVQRKIYLHDLCSVIFQFRFRMFNIKMLNLIFYTFPGNIKYIIYMINVVL